MSYFRTVFCWSFRRQTSVASWKIVRVAVGNAFCFQSFFSPMRMSFFLPINFRSMKLDEIAMLFTIPDRTLSTRIKTGSFADKVKSIWVYFCHYQRRPLCTDYWNVIKSDAVIFTKPHNTNVFSYPETTDCLNLISHTSKRRKFCPNFVACSPCALDFSVIAAQFC